MLCWLLLNSKVNQLHTHTHIPLFFRYCSHRGHYRVRRSFVIRVLCDASWLSPCLCLFPLVRPPARGSPRQRWSCGSPSRRPSRCSASPAPAPWAWPRPQPSWWALAWPPRMASSSREASPWRWPTRSAPRCSLQSLGWGDFVAVHCAIFFLISPSENSTCLNFVFKFEFENKKNLKEGSLLLLLLLLNRFSCVWLCNPIDGSPTGSCPWDSPGKNTGVGCHFLLQCMKVKVKLVSSVWLLGTPWTTALPGSSIHGIFQARVLEWVAIAFSWGLLKPC